VGAQERHCLSSGYELYIKKKKKILPSFAFSGKCLMTYCSRASAVPALTWVREKRGDGVNIVD